MDLFQLENARIRRNHLPEPRFQRLVFASIGLLCCLGSTAFVQVAYGQKTRVGARQSVLTDQDFRKPQEFSPSKQLEKLVAASFASTCQGWSCDELLLQDAQRQRVVTECRELSCRPEMADLPELVGSHGKAISEEVFCRALLHVRKRGGKLPRATRRTSTKWKGTEKERLNAAAGIAARRLFDEVGLDTDSILVDPAARKIFDSRAKRIGGEYPVYDLRKAALRLRKQGELEPELLTRVTDWKRTFLDFSVDKVEQQFDEIPTDPGIYLFIDSAGYIYIGQATNLRTCLKKHLSGSDRKTLAKYLGSTNHANVLLELHVFQMDSPGRELRVRRAYESELIRTRQPRLNQAP